MKGNTVLTHFLHRILQKRQQGMPQKISSASNFLSELRNQPMPAVNSSILMSLRTCKSSFRKVVIFRRTYATSQNLSKHKIKRKISLTSCLIKTLLPKPSFQAKKRRRKITISGLKQRPFSCKYIMLSHMHTVKRPFRDRRHAAYCSTGREMNEI